MWEKIAVTIVIELIKRRLDKTETKELTKIIGGGHSPKDTMARALVHPILRPKILIILADVVESILKKVD